MEKKKLTHPIGLLIIIIVIVAPLTIAWAYYFEGVQSSLTTTFKSEVVDETTSDKVYLRAYVFTYWTNAETNKIVGQSSWSLKESCINSNWTKKGDYYYYNTTIGKELMDEEQIPATYELIPSSATASQLSNDNLLDSTYIPVYKVVYEILEAEEKDGVNSSTDAWNVVYQDNQLVT